MSITEPTSPANAAPVTRRRLSTERVRRYFPLVLLAVLCAAFGILSDRFLTVGNLSIVAQQSAVLLTVALGVTFVIIAGSIDLSVGSMVALAALAAALGVDVLGVWAIVPAVLAGLTPRAR